MHTAVFELYRLLGVELGVTPAIVSRVRLLRILLAFTAWLAFTSRVLSAGASFAGTPVSPGGTVRANVPLSDLEKSYVAEGGNAVPLSHSRRPRRPARL